MEGGNQKNQSINKLKPRENSLPNELKIQVIYIQITHGELKMTKYH